MSEKFFIEYTEVYFKRRWKMKRQILLGLSVLMMAGVVSASDYDGTATGSHYSSKTLACSDARTEFLMVLCK